MAVLTRFAVQAPVISCMASWKVIPKTCMKKSMALLARSVKAAAGDRLQSLYGDIRNVIERTEDASSHRIAHPDTVESYDWGYVRRRIAELIEKYGTKVA